MLVEQKYRVDATATDETQYVKPRKAERKAEEDNDTAGNGVFKVA